MILPLERRFRRDAAFAQGDVQSGRDEIGGGAGIARVVVGTKPGVEIDVSLPLLRPVEAELRAIGDAIVAGTRLRPRGS